MDKKNLRKNIISKLNSLSKDEHALIESQIQKNLFSSDSWKKAKLVGTTISQDGIEWNTKNIIEQAWKEGKTVAIPKCIDSDRSMQFYEFQSYNELEVVYYDLKEPIPNVEREVNKNEIDLLIVPGIVFDSNGYRIGFGGGYYDRFLVDYHHMKTSLASKIQLVPEIPREQHDIAVDFLVTEEEVI